MFKLFNGKFKKRRENSRSILNIFKLLQQLMLRIVTLIELNREIKVLPENLKSYDLINGKLNWVSICQIMLRSEKLKLKLKLDS